MSDTLTTAAAAATAADPPAALVRLTWEPITAAQIAGTTQGAQA